MRVPLALGLAALLTGCAASGPQALAPEADLGRPSDGLLARPDLQAVVDLQLRRDGPALIAALADPDSLVRARAAFALGSVQDPEAVLPLRGVLSDPVPAVRADAAFALGQTADSTAGVALLVALRTEATPAVKAELLDALGKTGGRADLDGLLRVALPDFLEPARARALARFGIRDVTSPGWAAWLGSRLGADDAALREAAAYAFTRSPAEAWRAQASAIRAAFDARPGDPMRMHLARALDSLDTVQDVPRLATALADEPDWRTRVAIAHALQDLPEVAARDALARAVDDPNAHVAQTAAAAFADTEAPRPDDLEFALDRLGDDDLAWTVQAALLPLVARAGRADAVLAWAEAHPDRFAQAATLRALGDADDGPALSRLFTAARSDDTLLAAAALEGLVTQWETGDHAARRFFDAFAQGLQRRDLATTSIAAPVLADSAFWAMGTAELMRTVYRQLSAPGDIEPMAAIIRALGSVRDGAEVDFLVGVALEGHPALREVARDALNERLIEGVEVSVSGGGTDGTTSIDWVHLAQVGRHPRLVLETDRGRIVIEMDTEAAPQTVQLLTRTAAGRRYDGVPFHRVVANFVIQGGDYFRRDGYGGPETPIRSEFTRIRYETGTAGMASSGKDTEGVQFFVTHSPQPHLDGRYTAFGQVIEGQDVVDQILQGDLVRRARVVPDRRR